MSRSGSQGGSTPLQLAKNNSHAKVIALLDERIGMRDEVPARSQTQTWLPNPNPGPLDSKIKAGFCPAVHPRKSHPFPPPAQAEWTALFDQEGVWYTRVRRFEDMISDPQV